MIVDELEDLPIDIFVYEPNQEIKKILMEFEVSERLRSAPGKR